jgi:hypothetical protein
MSRIRTLVLDIKYDTDLTACESLLLKSVWDLLPARAHEVLRSTPARRKSPRWPAPEVFSLSNMTVEAPGHLFGPQSTCKVKPPRPTRVWSDSSSDTDSARDHALLTPGYRTRSPSCSSD